MQGEELRFAEKRESSNYMHSSLSIPLVRAHPAEFAPVQAVRLGLRFQADELGMPQVLIFADHF